MTAKRAPKNDLVIRLRNEATMAIAGSCYEWGRAFTQAADEIERLRVLSSATSELLVAMRAAIAQADKELDERFSGRTPECEAIYDLCVAAIAKADGKTGDP